MENNTSSVEIHISCMRVGVPRVFIFSVMLLYGLVFFFLPMDDSG